MPTQITSTALVAVVEDDPFIARALALAFDTQGFRTIVVDRGDEAVEKILVESPDAVVLDVNLPGKDGLTICRELRPRFGGPIVMLTARADDIDQILGLELGADDYIRKPADPRVVLAHVRACLRRALPAKTGGDAGTLRFGRLRICASTRTVSLDETEIAMQSAEFDLLWVLANHAGRVVSRDDIMNALRGIEHNGVDRSIDMRVSRLRKLLQDDPEKPRGIKTVRGRGYLFVKAAWS